MAKQDPRSADPRGRDIAARAFKYSCSFFEFADKKFVEMRQYRTDRARGSYMEAAIVVAALIQLERRPGGMGREALHLGVARSYAPTVAHQNLAAIQNLSGYLLHSKLEGLAANAIPSYEELAKKSDAELTQAIAAWLIRVVAKKDKPDEAHAKLATAMGRSAWTSAVMIVRAQPA